MPREKATVASAGASGVGVMSLQERPALSSAATSRLCALEPLPNATRLPLRSASVLIGESAGTMIAWVLPSDVTAATYVTLAAPACAKIGGVSPTKPKSTLPTLIASSSGGPN